MAAKFKRETNFVFVTTFFDSNPRSRQKRDFALQMGQICRVPVPPLDNLCCFCDEIIVARLLLK
jgi:hypothetical protein